MSAVRSLDEPKLSFGSRRLGWALALGSSCLLAAGLVWVSQAPRPDRVLSKAAPFASELALNVKLPSVAQVDQWTKTMDAPLEQETKLVLHDATTAIATLAQGFLPEDLLAAATENAQH